MTESERSINEKLDEILRILKNAGFTSVSSHKVVNISKKAREIKERLEKRNGGSPTRT